MDTLLAKLNAGSSGGIEVGDRFRITGELFEDDAWGVGATDEYSVYLKAKGGRDDLLVFVDRTWLGMAQQHEGGDGGRGRGKDRQR